jgi:hypothetical protein
LKKNKGAPEGRFSGGADCRVHHTTSHGGYIVTMVIWILGLKMGWRLEDFVYPCLLI